MRQLSSFLLLIFVISLCSCGGGGSGQTVSTPVVSPAALSITTASLADGALNTTYTATLTSTGGTPAVTWTVSAATLPSGLSLNSGTGVISGIPTAVGRVDFSVKATDHSTPPQTREVSLSITIAAAPLVITTNTLGNATLGTAYSATLNATGGAPPVTWSLSAGTLPSGLTLHAATGVIDGTPTGRPATTTFTVSGTDSGSPVQTKTRSLSITTVTGGANNAELNGHYAFLLRGFASTGGGTIVKVGSFFANGNGIVTGGIEDINTTSTSNFNLPITGGFYSVGADQRGTMTLTTSQGDTTFAFVLGSIAAGVSAGGRIIETDSGILSGLLKKQDSNAFSTSINGNFAFLVGGAASPGGRFAAAGVMATDGAGHFNISMDSNSAGTVNSGTGSPTTLVGTYAFSDTLNGRGTLSEMSDSSHMALYLISASEMFLINTDNFNVNGPPIFAGTAQKQSGTFTNASMSGNVVFSSQSAASYSGRVPATSYVGLGLFSANGAGILTAGVMDENDGGTVTPTIGTGTYTVASNGRMTIAIDGGGTIPEVFYLVSPGKAFSIGTNGAVSEGSIKPQSGSSFTNASISGNYLFGVEPAVVPASDPEVGVVNLDGAGHVTGTSDRSNGGAGVKTSPISDTYSVGSNGRVVLSESIMYIIAPSKAVMMSVTPGQTDPMIRMIEQ